MIYNITSPQGITYVNSLSLNSGDEVLFNRGETFNDGVLICQSGVKYGAYGNGALPKLTKLTTLSGFSVYSGNIYSISFNDVSDLSLLLLDGINTAKGSSELFNIDSHTSNTSITSSALNSAVEDWTGATATIRVERFLLERNTVTLHSGSTISFTGINEPFDDWKFFFQNDLKCLTAHGDWFHDGNTLYIYSDDDIINHTVQVPTVDTLVDLNNAENVTIEYLDMSGSNSHCVYDSNGGDGIIFQHNNVHSVGGDGFSVNKTTPATKEPIVRYNNFTDCNNNGISILNNYPGLLIRNNAFSRIGIFAENGMNRYGNTLGTNNGIVIISKNARVFKNTLIDIGYCGIIHDGSNDFVFDNYVENFCFVKDDGGAIYTLNSINESQDWSSVKRNVLNTSVGAPDMTDGIPYGHGIYLDTYSRKMELAANIILSCRFGIYNHDGNDIDIIDNVIYNCQSCIRFNQEKAPGTTFNNNCTMYRNLLIATNDEQWAFAFPNVNADFNSFGDSDNNYYINVFEQDVIFTREGGIGTTLVTYTIDEWKSFSGLDANSETLPLYAYDSNDYIFDFNYTGNVSEVTLDEIYLDVNGNEYTSYQLGDFDSIFLVKKELSERTIVRNDNTFKAYSNFWFIQPQTAKDPATTGNVKPLLYNLSKRDLSSAVTFEGIPTDATAKGLEGHSIVITSDAVASVPALASLLSASGYTFTYSDACMYPGVGGSPALNTGKGIRLSIEFDEVDPGNTITVNVTLIQGIA